MDDLPRADSEEGYKMLELSMRHASQRWAQFLADEEGEVELFDETIRELGEFATYNDGNQIPSTFYGRCRGAARDMMENPQNSTCSLVLQLFLVGVIAISVVELILSTEKELVQEFGMLFFYMEWGSFMVFSVEFVVRLWVTDGVWFSNLSNIIDTLAIMPQILELVIWAWYHYEEVLRHRESHFIQGLRILQAVRMMRLLRVLTFAKAARHSETLSTILESIWATRSDILLSVTFLVMSCVFTATAMYAAESGNNETNFTSIPACIWWSMVTLTTVGYGDMVPTRAIGKLIALLTMLLGTALMAVSVAAITTAFMEHYKEKIMRRNFVRAMMRKASTERSPRDSVLQKADLAQRLHKAEESVSALLNELTSAILSLDTMGTQASVGSQANALSEHEFSLMAAHALQDQSENFFKAAMRLAQRVTQRDT